MDAYDFLGNIYFKKGDFDKSVLAYKKVIEIDPEDDIMMLFTSGTTARPKAVQLTHANALFAGIFGAQHWKVVPEDRHFMVLPLFHVNGQFISVMPTLTAGATLVMAEQFSASKYMEQARRHACTTSSLVAAASGAPSARACIP